jgi:hypothetical protein
MSRRLGNLAVTSLSLALVACGSDSTNPGNQPDAKVVDGPVGAVVDAGVGIDAATFSATIALNSVTILASPTDQNPGHLGQGTVSFHQNPKPIDSKSMPDGIAPCSAASLDLTTPPLPDLDEGNVTFTLSTDPDAGVAATVTCSYSSTSHSYTCGDIAADVVQDGETAHVKTVASPSADTWISTRRRLARCSRPT